MVFMARTLIVKSNFHELVPKLFYLILLSKNSHPEEQGATRSSKNSRCGSKNEQSVIKIMQKVSFTIVTWLRYYTANGGANELIILACLKRADCFEANIFYLLQ